MAVDPDKARSIFLEAVDKDSPEECRIFLSRACGADDDLRRRVQALLDAHRGEDEILDQPPGVPALILPTHMVPPSAEGVGTVIGPYKLMEQIGEGGMGLVFVAEQQHPLRRKVALKVIKPGMDTRAVIARFEAERQALALMDHGNIAKVYDAGATASGRPYFVMELIKGVPITDYCDDNRLPPHARLELFISVCQAVQHAHQKGIIHRDLKPSNVLVSSHDGTPVVKIIDFGVAKAVGQQLTDKTVYTQFTQLVGTPLYMSPEQAGLSSLDMDTRTDIYALGVLLYELLTGTTPFDKERLNKATYEEIRRIIREEEPPRPSTRLSTLGAAAATAFGSRHSDPRRLGQIVRGELDWIVMKCLEKDRSRRYESASALARDVQRYLADEPVEACPPSTAYKLRKFAHKYRARLQIAGVFTVLVLAGGILSGVLIWREREEAVRQRDEARLQRQQAEANFHKARQAVDDYYTLMSENRLLDQPSMEPLRKQLLQGALRYYQEFLREHAGDASVQAEVVAACLRITNLIYVLGAEEDWLAPFQNGVEVMEDLMRRKPDASALQSLQAGIFRPLAVNLLVPRPDETRRTFEKARLLWEELVHAYPSVPGFQNDLAVFHLVIGIVDERQHGHAQAVISLRKALDLLQPLVQAHPTTPHYRATLALCLGAQTRNLSEVGHVSESGVTARQAVEIAKRLVAEFPEAPAYLELLAWLHGQTSARCQRAGHLTDALESGRQQLAAYEGLAKTFPRVARYPTLVSDSVWNLGDLLWDAGRRDEAAKEYERYLSLWDRLDLTNPDLQDSLASFLTTCPDAKFHDAPRAVALAEQAVRAMPQEGIYWTTLGIARYRAGQWTASIEALTRSMERGGDNSHRWFFLAMDHWRLGNKEEARRWYDKSVQWMEANEPCDLDLGRYRAEAAKLLGMEKN